MAALLTTGALPAAIPAAPAPAASAASDASHAIAVSSNTQASALLMSHETRHESTPAPLHMAVRKDAPAAWQRWGERLLALGVGAAVGWLLLRLGRDGSASRQSASDPR